jgi:hypothetical protein
VSITRAQALVIVVGNPFMLKADENWEFFLKYLKDNKAWVNTSSTSSSNTKTSMEYQELTALFDQIKIQKDDGCFFLIEAILSLLINFKFFKDGNSGISETTLKEHLEWSKYD